MQTSVYQANRNQFLLMSASIFVSVTAAVIVSTLLVMSLMRGEIASALNSTVNNTPTTSQVASTCAVPQGEGEGQAAVYNENSSVTPVAYTASGPLHYKHYSYPKAAAPLAHHSVNNSFNSSNVSNTTTNNHIKNTELHKTTIIKDSFNKDSNNDNSKGSHNTVVVKDNTVNVNSGNTTTTNTNSNNTKTVENTVVVKDNTVNVNSNNVANSNNTYTKNIETHVLSDNTLTVDVTPAVVPVVPAPLPTV